ncbi:MAG: Eco57I restriction-modification methylase domain-containing protein [Candidatus Helarchaeota archaeon]
MNNNLENNTKRTYKKNINENFSQFIEGIDQIISNGLMDCALEIFNKNRVLYEKDSEKYDNFEIFIFWLEDLDHKNDSEKANKLNFCMESILILLNKILLLKICEDKGFLQTPINEIKLYGENSIFSKIAMKDYLPNVSPLYLMLERIGEMYRPYYNSSVLDWVSNDEKLERSIKKILKFYNQYDFKNLDRDLFGYYYENSLSNDKKKSLGQFYTPIEIVDYILDKTGYNSKLEIEKLKLLDPCCGSGSFLIRAIRILIERYKKIYNTDKFKPHQARALLERIILNINGLEINKFACFLAIMNIFFQILEYYYIIMTDDFSYRLSPFHIFNINALDIPFSECIKQEKPIKYDEMDDNLSNSFLEFAKSMDVKKSEPNDLDSKDEKLESPSGFADSVKADIIVGNPPYIFIRDVPEPERSKIQTLKLKTNKGQWDLYQLFIEVGINLLNEGGYLGYIVPDSILANSERRLIREYIYYNCNIKIIHHVGKKFRLPSVANVVIILQKSKTPNYKGETRLLFSDEKKITNIITQNKIKEKWDFNFYLHLTKNDEKLIDKLQRNKTIEEIDKSHPDFYIQISRGMELTKKGKIFYCPKCKIYYPLPEKKSNCKKCGLKFNPELTESIVHDKKINDNCKLFVSDLNRYIIQKYQYIEIGKKGINYKSPKIYAPNRIIIRQLNQDGLICATIEPEGAYTSQSIYNINTNLNPYYLLGLLNSKLMSYYFSKIFGSYKALFPRILIEYIKKLPIVIPDKAIEWQLEQLVKKYLRIIKDNLTKPELNKCVLDLQPQIDSIVFNLFGLDLSEKLIVRDFFKNTKKV